MDDKQIESVIDKLIEGEGSRTIDISPANWVDDDKKTVEIFPDGTFSTHNGEYKFSLEEKPLGVSTGNSYEIHSADGQWSSDYVFGKGFDMDDGSVVFQGSDLEREAEGPDAKYIAAAQLLWNII